MRTGRGVSPWSGSFESSPGETGETFDLSVFPCSCRRPLTVGASTTVIKYDGRCQTVARMPVAAPLALMKRPAVASGNDGSE
jgi:hypothetical protein